MDETTEPVVSLMNKKVNDITVREDLTRTIMIVTATAVVPIVVAGVRAGVTAAVRKHREKKTTVPVPVQIVPNEE